MPIHVNHSRLNMSSLNRSMALYTLAYTIRKLQSDFVVMSWKPLVCSLLHGKMIYA